jgi:hypothetical protein
MEIAARGILLERSCSHRHAVKLHGGTGGLLVIFSVSAQAEVGRQSKLSCTSRTNDRARRGDERGDASRGASHIK